VSCFNPALPTIAEALLVVCALAATENSKHIAEMKNVLDVNTRFILKVC
jgi:hypothetical protein